MIFRLLYIITSLYFFNCQTSNGTQCKSKYQPFFNGTCMTSSNCLGATLNNICPDTSQVCCIEDPDVTISYTENKYVTSKIFLNIMGDTQRNRKLYYLFSRSLVDAQIQTCHQTAAYFAQIRGETKNFNLFEEKNSFIGKVDEVEEVKYRGRGALFLRGKSAYTNATKEIPITKYDLFVSPEAAAFPSVAFKIASWIWSKNSLVILSNNSLPFKGSLNLIADGTYHNFSLITYSFTTDAQSLKERSQFYEQIVNETGCKNIKRGRGVECQVGNNLETGYAVPICYADFKRSYCGCGGEFDSYSCPYGYDTLNFQCRNPSSIKCCHEKCNSALDIIIILDSSGSIGSIDFQKGKKFIVNLINELKISENDTRVGIINFSSSASVVTQLNSIYNKTKLLSTINAIPYEAGSTNTQAALDLANNVLLQVSNGMRSIENGVPKVVIVLTDGGSNVQPQLTIPNAQKIKNRGFSIVSIGVGTNLNQIELENIASDKNEVYNVDNFDKVLEIIESLIRTTCEQKAEVIFEKTIETTVPKNAYIFFQLTLNTTQNNFSVGVEDVKGSSELYYSFDEQNPRDPSEFLPTNQTAKTKFGKRSTSNSEERFYDIIIPTNINKRKLYLSVKGLDIENKFKLYVYNRTIPHRQVTLSTTEPQICCTGINGTFNIFSIIIMLLITIIQYID